VFIQPAVSVLGIGAGSLTLAGVYLIGSRAVFRNTALARRAGTTEEMSQTAETPPGARRLQRLTELRRPLAGFDSHCWSRAARSSSSGIWQGSRWC
jgi:hypothetical protein